MKMTQIHFFEFWCIWLSVTMIPVPPHIVFIGLDIRQHLFPNVHSLQHLQPTRARWKPVASLWLSRVCMELPHPYERHQTCPSLAHRQSDVSGGIQSMAPAHKYCWGTPPELHVSPSSPSQEKKPIYAATPYLWSLFRPLETSEMPAPWMNETSHGIRLNAFKQFRCCCRESCSRSLRRRRSHHPYFFTSFTCNLFYDEGFNGIKTVVQVVLEVWLTPSQRFFVVIYRSMCISIMVIVDS